MNNIIYDGVHAWFSFLYWVDWSNVDNIFLKDSTYSNSEELNGWQMYPETALFPLQPLEENVAIAVDVRKHEKYPWN